MNRHEPKYVLGFRFHEGNVLLIKKAKPAWQKGRMNGIGGKVEPGEESIDAMVREFREETGIETSHSDWKYIALMTGPCGKDPEDWYVRVYASFGPIIDAKTTTIEEVVSVPTNGLPPEILNNLDWLVPLCQDTEIAFPLSIPYKGKTTEV